MKDYTAERARLDAKHADALAELDAEARIIGALPEGLQAIRWRYHGSALYGTTGHLYADHDFYRYGGDDGKPPQPTIETVRALGEAYPGLPLVKVKDGCLSFRTRAHVDALPEETKTRWAEEMDVAPFLLKIDGFQQRTYEIEWTAEIAGERTRITVKLPLPWGQQASPARGQIGNLEIRYQDYKGGRRVDRCTFQPAPNLIDLFRGAESLAQLQTPIKWASGSEETPNSFTLYWVPLRHEAGEQPRVTDLVTAITGSAVPA